jgi:GNAT superfamily N-acetyltransferase
VTAHNFQVGRDDLPRVIDDIAAVYRAAFSAPPHEETEADARRFAEDVLPRHSERESFRCVVALDGSDRVIGFAYGYTGRPGQWWHDTVADAMGLEKDAAWLAEPFEVVTLAVMPDRQGKGIGGKLHDALLHGLPHRRAVLSVLHGESPALSLYRGRGWVELLDDLVFPGGSKRMLVMGRLLQSAGE